MLIGKPGAARTAISSAASDQVTVRGRDLAQDLMGRVTFTEYVLPEPYGIDRETWIDNSTDPVTVWYVDHEGWLVRIQPMD